MDAPFRVVYRLALALLAFVRLISLGVPKSELRACRMVARAGVIVHVLPTG